MFKQCVMLNLNLGHRSQVLDKGHGSGSSILDSRSCVLGPGSSGPKSWVKIPESLFSGPFSNYYKV